MPSEVSPGPHTPSAPFCTSTTAARSIIPVRVRPDCPVNSPPPPPRSQLFTALRLVSKLLPTLWLATVAKLSVLVTAPGMQVV